MVVISGVWNLNTVIEGGYERGRKWRPSRKSGRRALRARAAWENPPVLAPQMLQQRIQNGPLTRRKEGCKRETTQCMGRKLKQADDGSHGNMWRETTG